MLKLNPRELLRIGAVSVLGTAAGGAWRASGAGADGNGNQAIFIMLQGGPGRLDIWDPKPDMGREVRGPFDAIPTRITGVLFGDWPNVYSVAPAGGRVKRGFVHGSSDSQGGEVAESPVHPSEILATLWQHQEEVANS